MKQQTHNQIQIEESLGSLDGLQRATPTPFFFTRMNARLHRSKPGVWESLSAFVARPVVAIAGIFLIIAINATVVVWKAPEVSTPAYAEQDEQQTIPDEYGLAVNTIYDYVNPEQK